MPLHPALHHLLAGGDPGLTDEEVAALLIDHRPDPPADPNSDAALGIEAPVLDATQSPGFDATPLDSFLERYGAAGQPGGLQHPRGFLQGLVSGASQGAVGAGQRVAARRAKFDAAQVQRQAERDKANLAATEKYRERRGTALRDRIKADRADANNYVTPTPQQLADMPSLGRILDAKGRVPRSVLDTLATRVPPKTTQQYQDQAYGETVGKNRANREVPPPASQSGMYGGMDPGGTAEGIFDGTLPPDGYGRFQAQIDSELHKRHPHFNAQDATTNWHARQKLTTTLNNPQFTQLNSATQSAFDMMDMVDGLARQLQERLPIRSRNVPLNQLSQWLVDKGFAGDTETQNLVSRLNQTVGDVVLDGARVLNGGNAPQKEHLQQAANNLKASWGLDRILTGTKQFRGNLLTRTTAIAGTRPYSPPDVTGQGAAGGDKLQRGQGMTMVRAPANKGGGIHAIPADKVRAAIAAGGTVVQ